MLKSQKTVLGFSCGDFNGVGMETLIKSFSNQHLFKQCIPIVYVPKKVVDFYAPMIGLRHFSYNVIKNEQQAISGRLNIINLNQEKFNISPGQHDLNSGKISLISLDRCIRAIKNKSLDAMVTLPIVKNNIPYLGSSFSGHTEYLEREFKSNYSLMFLVSEKVNVATVTNHVPISQVSKFITQSNLTIKIRMLIQSLNEDFLIHRPKIAVLGLNPHAGDEGLVGGEEIDIIKPVIKNFFSKAELVYGPYSADGFFGTSSYKKFDAVLGMYHDQSLIPFKTLSFGRGVNFTAGLPIIRTSPDHGVAYDIAGRGCADESSLIEAILLACKIQKNRVVSFQNKHG